MDQSIINDIIGHALNLLSEVRAVFQILCTNTTVCKFQQLHVSTWQVEKGGNSTCLLHII